MLESWSRNVRIALFVGVVAVLFGGFLFLFLNRPDLELAAETEGDGRPPEAGEIAFFQVGRDTVLTQGLRTDLRKALGPDRLESWRPFGFEILPDAFPDTTTPELLAAIQPIMRPEIRELTGRHVVELTYRYAREREVPFADIRLVFSSFDRKPLLVELQPEGNGISVVQDLEKRYGPPGKGGAMANGDGVNIWTVGPDRIVAISTRDRYGKPVARVGLLFVGNLERFRSRLQEEAVDAPRNTGF